MHQAVNRAITQFGKSQQITELTPWAEATERTRGMSLPWQITPLIA